MSENEVVKYSDPANQATDKSLPDAELQSAQATDATVSAFSRAPRSKAHRAIRILGLFIILAAVVVAIGSFWILTGARFIEPRGLRGTNLRPWSNFCRPMKKCGRTRC
ncbi:MAG: hypothetical protein L3J13_10485 [Devosiaceae bacterium]|nr:hypothetical protein [Devosiaceae bacterium]